MPQALTNNQIKIYSSLKQKKFRRQHGLFIADGLHLVEAALNSDWQVEAVLVVSDKKGFFEDLNLTPSAMFVVPKARFTRISPSRSAQGVLAIVKTRKTDGEIEQLVKSMRRIVVLDNVGDPGNVGTIIRTAVGFGYDLVICLGNCAEIYNPKTIQATQGALFKIPIIELKDECKFIELTKGHITTITFSVTGEVPLIDAPAFDRVALIFGGEVHGIAESIEAAADFRVRIEQTGAIDSLNVAIAAGIAMYKFREVKLSESSQ